jgi:hypothetical protein
MHRLAPKPGDVFPQYFRQQGDNVDLAIYELSLRPDVPIMDLLYLEYLRARLAKGTIGEVLVVPWSGWRDENNSVGERRIRENVNVVFGHQNSRVTVVTASMLQEHAGSVFENHFFDQVGSLGNSDFLRNASAVMGYRFRSYHDINQGHPETHQARSIVEHTVRGWLIAKYVEANHLTGSNTPRRIGSLMWERELTKLLLLRNLLAHHPEIECSLMLGTSVSYRDGLKRKPIPTYQGTAITIFGDQDAQWRLLAGKGKGELQRTSQILADILSERAGLSDITVWGSGGEMARNSAGLHGEALAVAEALSRVRALYGVAVL